jgi:hypothetical protein
MGRPARGPYKISIILGGIRMPRVPPAKIPPVASGMSYLYFNIVGRLSNPAMVTEAPTIPVPAASKVHINMVPRRTEPRSGPNAARMLPKALSATPARLRIEPINTKRGTAGKASFVVIDQARNIIWWKT